MANGTHAIVLRIRGFNSEDNDWNIPSEITFRDVLVSLYSYRKVIGAHPSASPTILLGSYDQSIAIRYPYVISM